MKIGKEKLVRFVAYTLFGLITFAFFLILTFPFNLIEKTLLRSFEKNSGCIIKITQSEFGLPVKVSWRDITASCPKQRLGLGEEGNIDINLPSLDLVLQPLPLLLEQKGEVDFQIVLKGGNIQGHLTIAKIGEQFSFLLRAEEALFNIEEPGISGHFSIVGESEWVEERVLKGSGKMSFTVEKVKLKELGELAIPIGEVTFSKIEGQLFWKEGRVIIRQFSAKGETADLQSEGGNLILRTPLKNSLLTLALRATPKGSLKEMAGLFIQGYNGRDPLKIRMAGPLQAPQLSMNGQKLRLRF